MSKQQGSLREVMPVAAELVDWLREQFGREFADKLVRQGQAGRGGFYVAEIGPDGVFREFGSTRSGTHAKCHHGVFILRRGLEERNELPGDAINP
jgi:hypothetical protein